PAPPPPPGPTTPPVPAGALGGASRRRRREPTTRPAVTSRITAAISTQIQISIARSVLQTGRAGTQAPNWRVTERTGSTVTFSRLTRQSRRRLTHGDLHAGHRRRA